MSREAMHMALEALELYQSKSSVQMFDDAVKALRQALETEQKTAVSPGKGTGFFDGVWHEPGPTAWQCQCGKAYTVTCISSKPPKREWVALTDEEIYEYADKYLYQHGSNYGIKAFGKAIEAKLREKNT